VIKEHVIYFAKQTVVPRSNVLKRPDHAHDIEDYLHKSSAQTSVLPVVEKPRTAVVACCATVAMPSSPTSPVPIPWGNTVANPVRPIRPTRPLEDPWKDVREALPSSSSAGYMGARSCAVDTDAEFSVYESLYLDDDLRQFVSKDFKIKNSSLEDIQRAKERIGTICSQRPPAPFKISLVTS